MYLDITKYVIEVYDKKKKIIILYKTIILF